MLEELLSKLLGGGQGGFVPPQRQPGDALSPSELGVPQGGGLMALLGGQQQAQQQPQQPQQTQPQQTQEMSAQSRQAPAVAPAGGGINFGDMLGRLGPALMMMSGDPNYTRAGAVMAAQGSKNRQTAQEKAEERAIQNQTAQWLVSKGKSPQEAAIITRDPALMRSVFTEMNGGGTTEDIKNFNVAKQQGFEGSFMDYLAAKRGGAGEYGLQPIYGTGPDGKPVVLQLGKGGAAVQSKIPEGVQISTGIEKVDLGTQWGLLDKRSGQYVGSLPKDVAGKERQEEIGKSQGQASQVIPQVETTVTNALRTIDDLRKHPGIDIGTGLSSRIDPRSIVPGQPGYDFIEKNKTAQGQSFMAAREALKGAGQVTDFEGQKGEQAITNLNTAQSKEQYLGALGNLERMMKQSLSDLKKKAGVAPAEGRPALADPLGLR